MEKNVNMRAVTFLAFREALRILQSEEGKYHVLKDNRLIILTDFGQIFCNVDNDTPDSLGKFLANTVLNIRDKSLEGLSSEVSVTDDCELLVLENVVVVPFANPQVRLNYNVLTLFADQIVGISFGKPAFNIG